MSEGEFSPKISVVITTYGRPLYLREALESVVAQTYAPHEVIIVNDCSPEVTLEAPSNGLPVKYLRHVRNQGTGAARNTGMAHATGDWITFLDDDDLFAPDRLELAVAQMGDARMHATAIEYFSHDGSVTKSLDVFEGDLRTVLQNGSRPSGGQPAMGQVVFRREDLVQFNPRLRRGEDTEWWHQLHDRAIFAWSPEVGLRQRLHAAPRNYTKFQEYPSGPQ